MGRVWGERGMVRVWGRQSQWWLCAHPLTMNTSPVNAAVSFPYSRLSGCTRSCLSYTGLYRVYFFLADSVVALLI